MTPWYDHEIPMTEAAELGTRKVICDHSTVGIVVTTDGSVTEIPREDYLEAGGAGDPGAAGTWQALCGAVELRPAPELTGPSPWRRTSSGGTASRCLPVNCLELGEQEITEILQGLLYEFPAAGAGPVPAGLGGSPAAGPPHQNRRIPGGAPGGGGPGPCAAAARLPVRPAGRRRISPPPPSAA